MTALLAQPLDYEPELRWHVIYTAPRLEWFVASELRRLKYGCVYLWEMVETSHARRKIKVRRPVLPRYVFAGLSPQQSLDPIRETTGVATVLRNALGPLLVPLQVIDGLRARGNDSGLVAPPEGPPQRIPFQPGQPFRIVDGPFAGHTGRVELDLGNKIAVSVELFGRPTVAWAEPWMVEIDHPASRSCATS